MINLKPVKPKDKELLWNINQKYLYEMTGYYDDEMDENGNYHYGYFDAYFTELESIALFICENDVIVGFAMLNPYSYLGEKPDYVMAEFTVFPMYRRRHFAKEAAELILREYRGNWEIKYNNKNVAAESFWNKVVKQYRPRITQLNDAETVLSFCTE